VSSIRATHVWINYRLPGDSKTKTVALTNVPLDLVEEAIAVATTQENQ
jgi:hypothetical protein